MKDGDSSAEAIVTTPEHPPNAILRLQKCLIRPYCEGDAENLAKHANDPQIAKWMRSTFPYPYHLKDARSWISFTTSTSPVRHFGICRPSDNSVIGSIGLNLRPDNSQALEIGYWLGREHWYQGIMTQAVIAFSNWTFDNFPDVIRLEAEVYGGNEGSVKALKKTGFLYEGIKKNVLEKTAIEKTGVTLDILHYYKLRGEI